MTFSKKDADSWNTEYSHLKWGGLTEISWISNHLEKNDFLLDAGSGEGRYLRAFCSQYKCIGIDLSENALLRSLQSVESAASKNRENPDSDLAVPDHLIATVFALPFSESLFDGVLCLGVLQHLTEADRQNTLREFHRVLKKGGRIFFEAFGESDMRCKGDAYPSENPEERTFLRQNGIIYHYFNENEIKELFEKNGFFVLEFKSLKKEKKYGGENYSRHHYRAVFEKV